MINPANTNVPKVVLIGRTNAGKSTLFNRLSEDGRAIVSPIENTTRDQNHDMVYWKGFMFELIDTGGLDTAELDSLNTDIQHQVQLALDMADLALFVVDGKHELMPQDKTVKDVIEKSGKPVILCVNKVDNNRIRVTAEAEFASLNIEPTVLVSAANGSGSDELLDAALEIIPNVESPELKEDISTIDIALVGRPNVGKSSLFNAIVGKEAVIVSDQAHTTRDTNDTVIEYGHRELKLIDTAGVRRKSKVGHWTGKGQDKHFLAQIEKMGIHSSLKMVERSNVVVLVIEAQMRISKQDKVLVDYAQWKGKAMVIVANKWDLVPDKTPTTINDYISYFSNHLGFARNTPVIFTSALEGQRINDVLDAAIDVYEARHRLADQEILDNILKRIRSKQPKERRLSRSEQKHLLKPLELISLKQIDTDPPVFRLVCSNPKRVAPAILKIVRNAIYERCDFDGVPIKIVLRNS